MTTWITDSSYEAIALGLDDHALDVAVTSAVSTAHAILSGRADLVTPEQLGMWWASGGSLCVYGSVLSAEVERRTSTVDIRHREFVGLQYLMPHAREEIAFPVWRTDEEMMATHQAALGHHGDPVFRRASVKSEAPWWPTRRQVEPGPETAYCECMDHRKFVPSTPGIPGGWWSCQRCGLPVYAWLQAVGQYVGPFIGEGGWMDGEEFTGADILKRDRILLEYTITDRVSEEMMMDPAIVWEYTGSRSGIE